MISRGVCLRSISVPWIGATGIGIGIGIGVGVGVGVG